MRVEREFEGKDLEEALNAASRELGVPRESLEFRIVEEGRRGLFGLGVKLVRILVAAPETGNQEREAAPPPAAPPRASEPSVARSVEETVRRMVQLMGFDLDVSAKAAGDAVRVHLDGEDRRALLHKEAELLGALQFLLNRMARRAWPEIDHVMVECEGFRDRREEDLVEMAREVARQVVRTGRPKKLHSMNPYERRLVHLTVREFPGLRSHSVGDGFLKQITVAPVARGGEA